MSDYTNDSSMGTMRFADVPLMQPTVSGAHPFKNKANHDSLLSYLKQRLIRGKERRDEELNRWVDIDKGVAGWMRLDEEDQKRATAKKRTGRPQATAMNLPLAYIHLDDMMTYFAQTFAPSRGMFYNTGSPNDVSPASQIVTIMNNHAIYAGYFRETLQGLYSTLKYNRGGFQVFWAKDEGPAIVSDATTGGNPTLKTEIKWQGNRLEAIDIYNFLADPHVHPTKLHCDGEFAAIAKMRSHYWLQNKCATGVYFNCDDALKGDNGIAECVYYRSPPNEAKMDTANKSGTDWKAILSEYSTSGIAKGFELVEMYIKLNPTEFGLVPKKGTNERSRFETWRFTVLNNKWIIDATYMNNIHGYLPFFQGVLNDDLMGTSQKSTAEILTPLQEFASFLMNTHLAGTRKNIWGLTVYDPTMVDLSSIPTGEVSAKVAMKPESYGRDIRTGIWENTKTVDTKQTLQDLSAVMDIINQFFPTQSLPSQIANIDRAVDSQVAAVQQGANRRQQKAARLLDDTMFRNMRAAMYYNLIQYQPDDVDVQDFYTGKPVTIDLSQLRGTDLPFIIGQGLKALDRQAAASALQQIIFALIQAPQAAQGFDLVGLIDYWTSMIDIDVDMNTFRVQPAAPAADPNDPNAQAGAAAPAAAAQTGIQPATAPSKLTAPIYGGNGNAGPGPQ